MGLLTQAVMVRAINDVNAMSLTQKEQLSDEIFAKQPNLLGSILVLSRMGVSMPHLEVALHVLLVAFQAMKRSGRVWPTVTEDHQEACLERLTARMRFNEGLPAELANQVVAEFCEEHEERWLLAFAYGILGEHDLPRVRTDAEKHLLLAIFNLVECVALVGARPTSK